MTTNRIPRISHSEITPVDLYMNRRRFIQLASGLTIAEAGSSRFDTNETQTPYKDVTSYNNFYEFGIDKYDPARNAKNLKTQPWTISVEGFVKKPQVYALEDLLKGLTVEDRIYRMRC